MQSKRELLIILLIIGGFLIINTNSYTGRGSDPTPSGTKHRGCCYQGSDLNTLKLVEGIEDVDDTWTCSADIYSLNSGCLSIRFPAEKNIPGAGGLAGCYVRESPNPRKSAPRPGLYLDTCYGGSATRPSPSTTGGCWATPDNCWIKGKNCNIVNGEAKCV